MKIPQDLAAMRLRATAERPYFRAPLVSLVPVETPGIGTFGVDEHFRLYWDPVCLKVWTVLEGAWVMIHEVEHLVRDHPARAKAMSADPDTWNQAADAEINDDLEAQGGQLPGEYITPSRLGMPDGLTAEEYMSMLRQRVDDEREKQRQQAEQQQQSSHEDDDDPDDDEDGEGAAASGDGEDSDDDADDSDDADGDGQDQGEDGEDAADGAQGAGDGSEGQDTGQSASGGQQGGDDGESGDGQGQGQGQGDGQGQGQGQGQGDGQGQPGANGSGQGQNSPDPAGQGAPAAGNDSQSREEPKPQEQPKPGGGRCGSCASGKQEPWEQGPPEHDDASKPPGLSRGEQNLLRRHVAREVLESAKQAGNVPGGLKSWAEKVLNPRVPWERLLAGAIRGACADAAGLVDYTYSRISRRQSAFPRVVLPSLRAPTPNVKMVVDTSLSMNDHELGEAFGQVGEIIKRCGGREGFEVIACDTRVAACKTFMSKKGLEHMAVGRGGTDMVTGIEHAVKVGKRPAAVIVLTDGETRWPSAPIPGVKVICVLIGRCRDTAPKWIKTITLDDYKRSA